jgi:hypothetical protein
MISKHAVLPTGADNLRIGYNTLGVNLKKTGA